MNQIRNDIPVPTVLTRTCSKCNLNKVIDDFSLARGKHSEDRKSYCVKCESLMRKARKLYDLDLNQMTALLARPCSVCGDKASRIDKADRINGVLCERCWGFLKALLPTDDRDVITACYNYLVFREKYPFWLDCQLRYGTPNQPKPLIEWIENNERS